MQLIEELVQYADGSRPVAELETAQKELGDERLRVVVLKILGWLKSQHRLGRLRTLTIKQEYAWCQDAILLIKDRGLLLSTFQISEGSIKFADSIAEEKQAELCAIVDSKFSPRLMT